jgi:CBS domain-containing protein
MARLSVMPVGEVANFDQLRAFVPVSVETPLIDILKLISASSSKRKSKVGGVKQFKKTSRRVPIVSSSGEVIDVFSCLDFLDLALRFAVPSAMLQSRAAKTFDRRDTMMGLSVQQGDKVLDAFEVMDSARLTICPTTSRDLSGDLGGVLAINVISVSDLKYLITEGEYGILDKTVSEFVLWRSEMRSRSPEYRLKKSVGRFNVVSVNADDSLYDLATRLHRSKLHRIFLSCREISRIVGIVSSRDILVELMDQLLEQHALVKSKKMPDTLPRSDDAPPLPAQGG